MEQQPRSQEANVEQDHIENLWPVDVLRYEPTPERLNDLPAPVFNLEQMSAAQVADLIANLEKASCLLGPKEKKHKYEEDYDQNEARMGQGMIGRLACLLIRDIKCLAARDLERAEEIVFSLATHSDDYARAPAPELLRTLFRFERDNPQGQQQVLDTLVQLKQDQEMVVAEEAQEKIMDILWEREVDKATAQYLDEVADYAGDRPTWYWEE
jgi:hypothetical protein